MANRGWTDLSATSERIEARVNASLTAVPPPGPDAADSRAPSGGRLFLFGGDDGTDARSDLWVYDIAANRWEEPEGLQGDKPSPRSRHTLTLSRFIREETQLEEDRLYLFGGVGRNTEEVLYLDLLRRTWVAPRTIGVQAMALLGHTAAQVGSALYVIGGRDARRAYNTVWRLDTLTHEWSKPLPMGTQPPPCSKHTMIAQGSRLYLALGEISRQRVFIFDTTNHAWLQAEVAEDTPAPPLSRAAGALIGMELTIFGGMDEEMRESSSDVNVLDLKTMSWHELTPGGFIPSARVGAAGCAVGDMMFVFGGVDSQGYTSTFSQYDASSMVWEAPQLDGAAPYAWRSPRAGSQPPRDARPASRGSPPD
jgi:N-acetylneuraminic acid mutarotase